MKLTTKFYFVFPQEITLDVFLQVSWEDTRLHLPSGIPFIDLPWEFRQLIWTPDLYIWQLQTMRIMSVLQEMASLRLYSNSTVSVSIGFVHFGSYFTNNDDDILLAEFRPGWPVATETIHVRGTYYKVKAAHKCR